jgi:hypothetical protein
MRSIFFPAVMICGLSLVCAPRHAHAQLSEDQMEQLEMDNDDAEIDHDIQHRETMSALGRIERNQRRMSAPNCSTSPNPNSYVPCER